MLFSHTHPGGLLNKPSFKVSETYKNSRSQEPAVVGGLFLFSNDNTSAWCGGHRLVFPILWRDTQDCYNSDTSLGYVEIPRLNNNRDVSLAGHHHLHDECPVLYSSVSFRALSGNCLLISQRKHFKGGA